MENFLFVIDGFLSNYQRVSVCDELISQLRKFFPEKKILLLNKYNNSFNLETKVDYYFYYGDGFMVGEPPKEIIDDGRYSRPYVFFKIDGGTLENWMPDVGVTDHVANVFNGFLISSKIAKTFGYEKVFRIEYDMLFDENEILDLKEKLLKFEREDFLLFGKRSEGSWLSDHLSQIDIHFCGYDVKIFENFDVIKNDTDYWNFCGKIKYYGKFCEYFMSMVFELKIKELNGSEYSGLVRDRYPKSNFDRISSSGFWENRWADVPTISRISRDGGVTESYREILLFYRNNEMDSLYYKVTTNFGYFKEGTLNKNCWLYDVIPLEGELEFDCYSEQNGKKHSFKKKVTKNNLLELNTRFLFK